MLRVFDVVEEVAEASYSLPEIILWYSLLAFSIALFVIFLVIRSHKHNKGLATIQNSIQKELKTVVAKKEAIASNQKVNINLSGTSKKLSLFLGEFVAIKEKTSLPDADAVIGKTQRLIKSIHAANPDKMTKEEKIKYLDKVIERLTFIYGKLDVIRMLIQ